MYDLCAERLLKDDDRFRARNGHRFVECWEYEETTRPLVRSGELKENEIDNWVFTEPTSNEEVIRSGLRVLLSPKSAGRPSSNDLPYARCTYDTLARDWRIPSLFLRAATQKLGIVTEVDVAKLCGSPTTTCRAADQKPETTKTGMILADSIVSSSVRGLLIRSDVDWTWDYTLFLTHDPDTSITRVVIVGLTAVEIDLIQTYLKDLAVQSDPHLHMPENSSDRSHRPDEMSGPVCSRLLTHPFLLPLLLLDLATDDTAALIKVRTKLLSEIQQQTGMDRFNSLRYTTIGYGPVQLEGRTSRLYIEKDTRERHELDLDAIMLRLTCLSDWMAAQRGFVGLQLGVVRVLEGLLQDGWCRADVKEDARGKMGFAISGYICNRFVLRERLEFIRQSLLAAERKCAYLDRTITAQVQTIYSLIAQKDNRLNIAAASASCQIASDSRRIAILTRKDGTEMRLIAAVTLVFLPGTFVATVFSTGLFDWGLGRSQSPSESGENEGEKLKISPYLWVYMLLTGVLTLMVLVGWGAFSWVQNQKMVRRFGEVVGMDIEKKMDASNWRRNELDADTADLRRDTESTMVDGRCELGRYSKMPVDRAKWEGEVKGALNSWKKGMKLKENKRGGTWEAAEVEWEIA